MASTFPKHLLSIYTPSLPHEANQQDDETEASPPNVKDNRIRAENKHYKDSQSYIRSIGLLRCVFEMTSIDEPDGYDLTVTGTAVIIYTQSDVLTLLTCAHNVKKQNKHNGEWVRPKHIVFELRQNTKSYFVKKDSVINKRFFVSPEDCWTHADFERSPASDDGYDIAVLKCSVLEEHANIESEIKTINDLERLMCKMSQYKQNRELGCLYDEYDQKEEERKTEAPLACVVGFPFEKKGQLYGMKGKVCTPTHKNAVLFYNKLITSGGQSGSPILQLDHINDDLYSSRKTVVGIHTGGNNQGNWGTKITEETKAWIDECVKKNRFQQEPEITILDNSNYALEYVGDQWNIDVKAIEKQLNTMSPADYSKAFPKLINATTLLTETQQRL